MKSYSLKLLVLTVAALLLSVPSVAAEGTVSEFAGGDGSESNPYLLSTTAHLDNARKYPDAHFRMISDIAFAEEDFAPGGAFYNEGIGWEPIGGYRGTIPDDPFTGVFDGDGHTITGLRISYDIYPNDQVLYIGLIGYASGATIQNLHMAESSITLAPNSPTINSTTCHRIGSIVGAAKDDSVVTNCRNSGTVSSPGKSASYTGGVAGAAEYISKCWNTGAIDGGYAGGVVGAVSYGEIANCWNTGAVTGISYAGGITGEAGSSTVTDCYNTGPVTGTERVGGITGWLFDSGRSDASVLRCYNTGNVTGTEFAGGIVGEFACSPNPYYWDVVTHTITDCFNTANVTSTSLAGGIAASMGVTTYASSSRSSIKNSYNIGDIAGTTAGAVVGKLIAGSMVGCYYSDTENAGVGCFPDFGFIGNDTAIRCTDAELKTQSTFEEFDFEDIWTHNQLGEYPYPILRGMEMTLYSVSAKKTDKGVQIWLTLAEKAAAQDITLILGEFNEQGKMTDVTLFDDAQLELMLADTGASVSLDDYSYCKLILLNKAYIPLLSETSIT